MVKALAGWPRLHRVQIEHGVFRARDLVTADVLEEARDATRRHHTATHLLHAALRQVLGTHVKQAGSLVSPERLRFDFVHGAALTREQTAEIERLVNREIARNTPVQTEVRSMQEAVASGAMALFGEKYGDRVRVVSVPGFSMELCGGTHCRATGDIGGCMITGEGGIAAGVRRVEAVTGAVALQHVQEQRDALDSVLGRLRVPAHQAGETIDRLQADVKRLTREVAQLKMKAAIGGGAAGSDDTVTIGDVRVLTRKVADLDKGALRDLADSLKDTLGRGVVVLGAVADDKVQFVVSVTADLTARVHAGKLVKQLAPIVGGGGGGRPDFAEAGGRLPEKLDDLLAACRQAIEQMLAS
jgi:alanyl-tRNA synthetase